MFDAVLAALQRAHPNASPKRLAAIVRSTRRPTFKAWLSAAEEQLRTPRDEPEADAQREPAHALGFGRG